MTTAIVLPVSSDLLWNPQTTKLTHAETQRVAIAFCDGAYVLARKLKYVLDRRYLRTLEPDYATLRDYLIHDCNADERIAAMVALNLTKSLRQPVQGKPYD